MRAVNVLVTIIGAVSLSSQAAITRTDLDRREASPAVDLTGILEAEQLEGPNGGGAQRRSPISAKSAPQPAVQPAAGSVGQPIGKQTTPPTMVKEANPHVGGHTAKTSIGNGAGPATRNRGGQPGAGASTRTTKNKKAPCRRPRGSLRGKGQRAEKRTTTAGYEDELKVDWIGSTPAVEMGGRITALKSKVVEVSGVNGCTALFMFGGQKRTAAHLTENSERVEAKAAAEVAVGHQNTAKVSIHTHSEAIAEAIKSELVAAGFPANTNFEVKLYTLLPEDGDQYYAFKVAANSDTVVPRTETQAAGSSGSSSDPGSSDYCTE